MENLGRGSLARKRNINKEEIEMRLVVGRDGLRLVRALLQDFLSRREGRSFLKKREKTHRKEPTARMPRKGRMIVLWRTCPMQMRGNK